MDTEGLMREILSKLCPYHGRHPDISLDKEWKLTVSACCIEFKEMMEAIKKNFENRPNWVPELQNKEIIKNHLRN